MALRALTAETQRFLTAEHMQWIGGRWVPSACKDRIASIDPASGKIIAYLPRGDTADADAAVAAARTSFVQETWLSIASHERGRILQRVADLIECHADELAELEAIETGKLFAHARHGDVAIAARAFRYHAGWCDKLDGSQLDLSAFGQPFACQTRREPLGVAALIVPSNGATAITAWKLAPALAAGCSVVVKPHERATLPALRMAELLQQAGIPDGVVNVLCGSGPAIGARLAEHADVDVVSFTGSTEVGRKLLQAAAGNFKKLILELGGKSAAIVYADADFEAALSGVAAGIFGNAGQVCVACSRIYVERPLFERFARRLAQRAQALRLGAAFDEESEMGPLISEDHRAHVDAMVQRAIAAGAVALSGGAYPNGAGYFYPATVLTHTDASMEIVREEVFGPVACVMPFDSDEEVIAQVNDSRYGLAGSVWTRDLARVHRLTAAIQAGLLWVNAHGVPDVAVPFGGYRQSGWGREQGREAVESFTQLKSVMIQV
jgi:phenylacetaldehyde dehydrogenase